MAGFVPFLEKSVGSLGRGFIAQIDPNANTSSDAVLKKLQSVFNSGITTDGFKVQAETRVDGRPVKPIIVFDYDSSFQFGFKNNYTSISGNRGHTAVKFYAGREFPTIKCKFFLDISRALEQTSNPFQFNPNQNTQAEAVGNRMMSALSLASNISAGKFLTQLLGGINIFEAGVQPFLDKYEAIATPDTTYSGVSEQYPCLLVLNPYKMHIGYVTDLNYKITKTTNVGVPTRAEGSFSFMTQPYMENSKLSKHKAFVALVSRTLNFNLGDRAKEGNAVGLTSALTGGNLNLT